MNRQILWRGGLAPASELGGWRPERGTGKLARPLGWVGIWKDGSRQTAPRRKDATPICRASFCVAAAAPWHAFGTVFPKPWRCGVVAAAAPPQGCHETFTTLPGGATSRLPWHCRCRSVTFCRLSCRKATVLHKLRCFVTFQRDPCK